MGEFVIVSVRVALHLPHIVLAAHLVREACVGAAGVRMCVALQYLLTP